jgi:hypothetical protein
MSRRTSLLLIRSLLALSLAVPFVVFGLIDVLAVEPRRAAEQSARAQAETLGAEASRMLGLIRSAPVTAALAQREFERRTSNGDAAPEVLEAIASLVNSPAVGGVSNLSIDTGEGQDPTAAVDPRIRLFQPPIAYTMVAVSFDARYAQIGRFFWNLRTLPSTFELRSVEVVPAPVAPLMRAKLVLFVFQRPGPAQTVPSPALPTLQMVDVSSTPEWHRDPFAPAPQPIKAMAVLALAAPEPVVHSILFSPQRRVALVDGRIVRAGDYLDSARVVAVEQDAVVILTSAGVVRRLALVQPPVRATRR